METNLGKKKIAVVGTGIAGLVCSHLLSEYHDVVVFEKEASIGMGAHGFDLPTTSGADPIRIDFPHRVINIKYYANLVHLLKRLGIVFAKEDFAMSVTDKEFGNFLRWSNLRLGQRSLPLFSISSIFSNPLSYCRLFYDSIFFFRRARADLASGKLATMLMGTYVDHLKNDLGYSPLFIDSILMPVLAIVNTCDFDSIRAMPADIPIKYLTTSTFTLRDPESGLYRPVGGVPQIISVLSKSLKDVRTNSQIQKLEKLPDGRLQLTDTNGKSDVFDHVVFATQANHAMNLVKDIDPSYKDTLGKIRHTKTRLVLHTDRALMPAAENQWSSFNVLVDRKNGEAMGTLWMNKSIPSLPYELYQTVNPITELDQTKILHEHTFERPIIDQEAANGIMKLQESNGSNNIWFCGAYSMYGMPLLENGVNSAFCVAEKITGHKYERAPPSSNSKFRGLGLGFSIVASVAVGAAISVWFKKNPKATFDLKSLDLKSVIDSFHQIGTSLLYKKA